MIKLQSVFVGLTNINMVYPYYAHDLTHIIEK